MDLALGAMTVGIFTLVQLDGKRMEVLDRPLEEVVAALEVDGSMALALRASVESIFISV